MKEKLSGIFKRLKRIPKRPDRTPGKSRKTGILILVVVLAIGAACAFGATRIYDRFHGGTVNVYSFTDVGLDAMMAEDDSEMEGTVSTDQLQTEYLSDSETVDQVYVKKGQKVKEGDKLFSYDTTLSQLDLQRKNIEIQKKELELTQAKKRLAVIQTYRAGVPVKDSVAGDIGSSIDSDSDDEDDEDDKNDEDDDDLRAAKTASVVSLANVVTLGAGDDTEELAGLELLGGDGSKESPYCYYWQSNFQFTNRFIEAITQGKDEAFVRFALDGEDIQFPEDLPLEDGEITVTEPDEETPEDPADDTTDDTADQTDNTDAQPEAPEEDSGETGITVTDQGVRRTTSGQVLPMTLTTQKPQVMTLGGEAEEETEYFACWTMQFQKIGSSYRFLILSINVGGAERVIADPLPAPTVDETPEDDPGDGIDGEVPGDDVVDGIVYTRSQLAQLIAQAKEELTTLERDLRKLKIEYQKQQIECDEDTVYAKVAGVVTTLRDPKKAGTEKAFIKVSGDGAGYKISGSVSELELSRAVKGASVTVTNEEIGEEYQGTVEEVMNYPTSSSSWNYTSNSNVSYYPFTIKVDDSAEFNLDDYITISFDKTEEENASVYLMKCFIRAEDGKSYIYVAGEDGTLEKRYVTTGKDVWGYYTEIKSGLNESEQVAFPYGQHVREGAPTVEASIEALYNE
ncbi:MAG: biotin/lipoyl-binding protein [Eubacteriales bacterium]|nr:biotin/lipoyl-binding protein [Eubacteriales bacterium]